MYLRYFDGSDKAEEKEWESKLCDLTKEEWEASAGEYHVACNDGLGCCCSASSLIRAFDLV